MAGLRTRITFIWIRIRIRPDPAFHLYAHQGDADLRPPFLSLHASNMSVYGFAWHHYETPQFLNFDFHADPDPSFRRPAFQN